MGTLGAALNGVLLLSAIYALLSLGLVLIFRATRVLNFAAGAIGLVGAYLVYELSTIFGSFYPALVVGIVVAIAFGALIYLGVLSPISGARASIGASTDVGVVLGTIILAELLIAAVPFFAGSRGRPVDVPLPAWQWSAGGLTISSLQIVAFVLMIAVVVGVAVGLRRSPLGLRMRAAADSPRLARLNGISTREVATVTWALSALVSMLGVLLYATSTDLQPASAAGLGAALFPALLLGGLDSIGGCILGSIVLALVQSFSAVYLGGEWMAVSPYIFLLLVLIVRPQGFFGKAEFSRL
ncbi:branched-chain amino acid ABC transporter permease [Pseudonocardia ailaonensis]|uniref:Branched-chain amino acid ABC transporter permease n=1 Tax=Pseudonocardia ailaonensis TaxID=367279 RepID=A0ABN2MY67_9PSEU